jgi:hypothetical protein
VKTRTPVDVADVAASRWRATTIAAAPRCLQRDAPRSRRNS